MKIPTLALARISVFSAAFGAATAWASGGEQKASGAAAPVNPEFIITNNYVHHWIQMPPLAGKNIDTGEATVITPEKGQPTVLIFLASWCLPCQKLTRSFEALRAKYAPRSTRFVYVFTHDTRADALAFAKDHKLKGDRLLASRESLKAYHEPELPTVYVGDRAGWLVERYVNVAPEGLKDLDGFLAKHTSF